MPRPVEVKASILSAETNSLLKKMAPGLTKKMKHMVQGDQAEGARHGHEEGKAESPHGPVLIDQPGTAESSKLDGTGLRIAIIASRWYKKVVHSLVDECSEELLAKGVADEDLHLVEVAGAFEIPFAAARLVHSKDSSHRPDAVICIGCIVNDATHMCETMSQAVANGIMKLNVTSDTPVIFGVLCCDSESQACVCAEKQSCSAGGEDQQCNHGVSWAQSALEMAHLKRCASSKKGEHCRCVRCESRGEGGKKKPSKHESEKHEAQKLKSHGTCTTCQSAAEKCSCKDCKCKVCCDNRGECTSCKLSGYNCSCVDCKCHSCCSKRDVCRGCGCPPNKCSCQGCNCASCSKKETIGMKMPIPSTERESASKHEPSSSSSGVKYGESSEHETARKHEPSSSSSGVKHGGSSEHETVGKQESSSFSSGVKHGESSECGRCGSPGGKCMCGLLH